MKNFLLWGVIAATSTAIAGNSLLLDMESVASITSKNAKFHGGAFADGAPIGNSVTNGNRGFVGGGAKEGIELPISALPLKEGSISLYFKINKQAAPGKAFTLVNAVGTPPYHNNFGISVTPGGSKMSTIQFTLIGPKVKGSARSVSAQVFLDSEVFYHLAVNWKNINSGKADGVAEIYLNGKLIAAKRNTVINLPDPGKKLFIGSCDIEHAQNKCGKGAFVLDEVNIFDKVSTRAAIKASAGLLPLNDMADGRILPGMPVKGGGKNQFTAYTIDNFPVQHGAIFCRFRLDEIIPKKSIILFDNTATPSWNNRFALMLKMFDNNVVEFYFSINGARTKVYSSKTARKTMPLDPTSSHTVMVLWKNINNDSSNGSMDIYVDGVNVAATKNFLTRFDKTSDVLRVGGGVPPSGVFARKDLLTIEEFRIWRGNVPADVMGDLFNQKSVADVAADAAINLPIWDKPFKNDGKIDRNFWLRAADFGNFHSLRYKGVTENITQVKAATDDNNLYLAWKAKHSEPRPTGKRHDLRDMALWRQDSLEFHFDTPKGQAAILVSAYNEIYDSLARRESWTSAIKSATALNSKDRIWTGTAVIPLAEITADKKQIKGAVCRNVSGMQTASSSWKRAFGARGVWNLASPLVVSNIAMPDMISAGSNDILFTMSADGIKKNFVRIDLSVISQGKRYNACTRREVERDVFEVPLSFDVPTEGNANYSLTVKNDKNEIIWSNSGVFDVKPKLSLTLKNKFYDNKLLVNVNGQNINPQPVKGEARILKNGVAVSDVTTFTLKNGMADIAVDTSKMNQHAEYIVEVTVTDEKNKKSTRIENFEFSPKPSGYPLNAGKKPYFGQFWTSPVYKDGVVSCWNRVYSWKNTIFPASITSGKVEMLAETPYFEYRVNGKLKRLSSAKVTPKGGDKEQVCFQVNAKDEFLQVDAQVRVEYDGFIGYELNAKPLNNANIDKLAMVFPMKKESAQIKLQGLETTYSPQRNLVKNYPAEGKKFAFASKAGLGCFERGLFYCNESDEGWLPYDRKNVEEIIPAGDKVLWKWNIVDGAKFAALPTQRMGFQVTPYKPLVKDQLQNKRFYIVYPGGILRPGDVPYKLETLPKIKALGVTHMVMGLNWAKYCGGYEPDDRERFRKFVQEAHKLGMKVLVYRASITNPYEPSFLYYNDLWLIRPTGGFFGNPVNNKYKLSSFGRCTNAPGYIDWYVGMAAQLIKDYDVDGFYYDFGVGGCNNVLHGCGYVGRNTTSAVGEATGTIGVNISEVTEEDRGRRLTTPVLRQRELWKRMYNMVKELKGEDGVIDAHTSAPDRVFSYPFVDSMYHSESAATHADLEIDPDMYRCYLTKQFLGTRGELIMYIRRAKGDNDPAKKCRATLALTLLHREIYRPATGKYEFPARDAKTIIAVKIWEILQRNKVDEAQWLPYWENKDYITIENGTRDTLTSLWRHDDRLLVVVSNLSKEPKELVVTLKGKCAGFKNAFDAELYKTKKNKFSRLPLVKNKIKVKLNAKDYKLIEITK